jgi:hypothetical protein
MYYLDGIMYKGESVSCSFHMENCYIYHIKDCDTDFHQNLEKGEVLELAKEKGIYGVADNHAFPVDKRSTIALNYIDDVKFTKQTGLDELFMNSNLEPKRKNDNGFRLAKTGEVVCIMEFKNCYQSNSIVFLYDKKSKYATIYNYLVSIYNIYPELVSKPWLRIISGTGYKNDKNEEIYHVIDVYLTKEFARWHTKNKIMN